jgi:hypothetical protein
VPSKPSIQSVSRALSPELKRSRRPFNVDVGNGSEIFLLPHTSSWRSALLSKHRDKCTFTLMFCML